MGRGQYDRAAAKAKREVVNAHVNHQFVREGFPYVNDLVPELQAKLDAATALNQKYAIILKRNGLWLDE